MREVTVAATQMACEWDRRRNLERAEHLVRTAAGRGAPRDPAPGAVRDALLLQGPGPPPFRLAQPLEGSPLIAKMSRLAAELGVVLPISFFERANNAYFNSLTVIDADGRVLGVYRKSHIPDGPGYQEKFYFNLGDTGFRVWQTKAGVIGVGICWDQWFPEAARIMALLGAELIFYPTAIGSEPHDTGYDSRDHWQRVMQGHAAANMIPVDRVEPHRHRGGDDRDAHLLRQLVHRRQPRRQGRGGAARGRGGADRHLRPRRPREPARRLGPVPRPAAGPLRPDPEPGRPRAGDLTGGSGCRQATFGQRGERPAGSTLSPSLPWPGSTGPPRQWGEAPPGRLGPPVKPGGGTGAGRSRAGPRQRPTAVAQPARRATRARSAGETAGRAAAARAASSPASRSRACRP